MSKLEKLALAAILVGALFVRWYRLGDLLGFHFDQGRDALVIRRLLTEGKMFLVGPVTGLEGIFLGPLLYYLLTPFYWLGQGNPVAPAMFLSGIQAITIYALFLLGRTVSKLTAFLAATIYAFSQSIFWLNRWLSNPPPVMVGSAVLIYSLYQISQGKRNFWILSSLAFGFSLQFEVASAAFFIPAIIIFLLWQWKNRPSTKIAIVSAAIFIFSLLPQIWFDFRHDHIMTKNIYKQFIKSPSFSSSNTTLSQNRLQLYRQAFGNKLFAYDEKLIVTALPLLVLFGILSTKFWLSPLTKILLIFILSQLIPLLFFQGNSGNVWDYHFSGNFPIFVLLVSIWFGTTVKTYWGKVVLLIFIFLFIKANYLIAYNSLIAGVDGPIHITLGNQKQSVHWVYQDAANRPFNVDVYVPPVIPYAYDYLFAWIGDQYGYHPSTDQIPLLYTLYEQDPPHPERLEAWLKRQQGIGKVDSEIRFGGITVQRRTRI